MSELLPAMRYDFNVVSMPGPIEAFRHVRAEALLLGGDKSPTYLKDALKALEQVLPRAYRKEFEGLDHWAPWNRNRGGNPLRVAEALREFFGCRTGQLRSSM